MPARKARTRTKVKKTRTVKRTKPRTARTTRTTRSSTNSLMANIMSRKPHSPAVKKLRNKVYKKLKRGGYSGNDNAFIIETHDNALEDTSTKMRRDARTMQGWFLVGGGRQHYGDRKKIRKDAAAARKREKERYDKAVAGDEIAIYEQSRIKDARRFAVKTRKKNDPIIYNYWEKYGVL